MADYYRLTISDMKVRKKKEKIKANIYMSRLETRLYVFHSDLNFISQL